MIRYSMLGATLICLLMASQLAVGQEINEDAKKALEALNLTPNIDNGRKVYQICAVCHAPEAWGTESGSYPQIAGQHSTVIIKQIVDILARNRDTPIMFPFVLLENVKPQELADVAAYLSSQPMSPNNGLGLGFDLEHGKKLYEENCVDCHGKNGEGNKKEYMPLIQGQHYNYLVRQFKWIRDGKRRNADQEMVEQIQRFNDRDISAIMDYTSRLKPPAGRTANPGWQNPDFPTYVRKRLPK